MSDDLTPEEEGAIERLFASHPPLGLGMGWETELRVAIAGRGDDVKPTDDSAAHVVELSQRLTARGQFRRLVAVAAAVVAIMTAGSVATVSALREQGVEVGTDDSTTSWRDAPISIVDAELSVSVDRDVVTVNGEAVHPGNARMVVPGDTVAVDKSGSALVLATEVFEVEALRNAEVTVPDLSQGSPVTVSLITGDVFVRLNPAAQVTLVVDTGDRQFTTKSPDAEFALCQTSDGESCLVVIQGSVEWKEDGVATEVYQGGQATSAPRAAAPLPTRCADATAIGDMQSAMRGLDFGGSLGDILASWNACPGQDEVAPASVVLPSAAGMAHVTAATVTVGSPSVTADTPNVSVAHTQDGSADFYIEPVTVTNALFRAWIVRVAGDDAVAWRRLAPTDWLERAAGDAATQATYADGTADQPVQGVRYATASEYCASQGKRLPTEVEWELATANGVLVDLADEAQDWVTNWEAYGPGPPDATGRQVLRGVDGALKADPYYRTFAPDSPEATTARTYARIRCAADQVATGGRAFPTVITQDDFSAIEWPTTNDNGFELGYHPEAYHLDVSNEHSQLAVVRALTEPLTVGRIDIDAYIERINTGISTGEHRFGLVVGGKEQLFALSVQPDEKGRTTFLACLTQIEPAVAEKLNLAQDALSPSNVGRYATLGRDNTDYDRDCSEAAQSTTVEVTTIDSPIRLSFVQSEGQAEVWVNEVLVTTMDKLPAIEIYGFMSQNYNRTRSHVHIDQVTVSTE